MVRSLKGEQYIKRVEKKGRGEKGCKAYGLQGMAWASF
jgi:hypothetical protein